MKESYYLEKDRIPVFIGKGGSSKANFEKKFNCTIEVNSETGEVLIDSEDGYKNFILSNIINAINHGHSPENALKLEDDNFVLDLIDVKSIVKNHDRVKIVIGRIIGKEGTTRRIIEEVTNCNVSVKDSFVSVIGPYENIALVHEALDMLIKGASHKSFYSYLERNRTNMDKGLL